MRTYWPRPRKFDSLTADFADEPVGRRIAARHRERAGRLILDIHVHDDAVRRRAGLVGDPHPLEVAEIVEATLGAVDENLVVGVALADVELAADDVVTGAGVAANVDPLDVDARPLLDDVAEVDRCWVAGSRAPTGRTCANGIAAASHLGGDVLQRALDLVRVVDRARGRRELAPQRPRCRCPGCAIRCSRCRCGTARPLPA